MKKKLDEIIAYKKLEVIDNKAQCGLEKLMQQKHFNRSTLSLKNNILNPEQSGIIAEFKRQSPSKGVINNTAEIYDVVAGYAKYGASGVSILTDAKFFGAYKDDIENVRTINIPILRKEFIVDEYQIFEAKAMGADCILLIAACLSKNEIFNFSTIAKQLGLEILLEMHDKNEIEKINDQVDMVGINNRNLQTFEVDLKHSLNLLQQIPKQFVSIAESGITGNQDIETLRSAGFKGFLIGEQFMKTKNPAIALKLLLQ